MKTEIINKLCGKVYWPYKHFAKVPVKAISENEETTLRIFGVFDFDIKYYTHDFFLKAKLH